MGTVTSAITSQFKRKLLLGGYCFQPPLILTGISAGSGSTLLTGLANLQGLSQGCFVFHANIPFPTFIAGFPSSTSILISQATTGAIVSDSVNTVGDEFKLALIKTSPTGSYGAATANYSDLGADEVVGTGYTAGGMVCLQNGVGLSGTTAYLDFADISWTGATFSFTGAFCYSNNDRFEGEFGSAVFISSLGNTSVSSGTLTVVFPPPGTGAILTLT